MDAPFNSLFQGSIQGVMLQVGALRVGGAKLWEQRGGACEWAGRPGGLCWELELSEMGRCLFCKDGPPGFKK